MDGWLNDVSNNNGFKWWIRYLKTNNYSYNISTENLNNFFAYNYSLDTSNNNFVILDTETIGKIQNNVIT